jgi:hypothetical protein
MMFARLKPTVCNKIKKETETYLLTLWFVYYCKHSRGIKLHYSLLFICFEISMTQSAPVSYVLCYLTCSVFFVKGNHFYTKRI